MLEGGMGEAERRGGWMGACHKITLLYCKETQSNFIEFGFWHRTFEVLEKGAY